MAMRLLLLGLVPGLALPAAAADLAPADAAAFTRYTAAIESGLAGRAQGDSFLFLRPDADQWRRLKQGEVVVEPAAKPNPLSVGHSLIHDWTGAVFVPGVKLDTVLAVLQDFANHKTIYSPDVIDSRQIARNGSETDSFLRVRKKKVITVILNSEYHTRFFRTSPTRLYSIAVSTKITELKDDGTELAPGTGYGFLWRLNSYWQLEERDGGVLVECRAVTLTRDVPAALNWIIAPMVRSLPKESLESTLNNTRNAAAAPQRASGAR